MSSLTRFGLSISAPIPVPDYLITYRPTLHRPGRPIPIEYGAPTLCNRQASSDLWYKGAIALAMFLVLDLYLLCRSPFSSTGICFHDLVRSGSEHDHGTWTRAAARARESRPLRSCHGMGRRIIKVVLDPADSKMP